MESFSHGRTSLQFRFLRRQFLQDGNLPFTSVLTVETITRLMDQLFPCLTRRRINKSIHRFTIRSRASVFRLPVSQPSFRSPVVRSQVQLSERRAWLHSWIQFSHSNTQTRHRQKLKRVNYATPCCWYRYR